MKKKTMILTALASLAVLVGSCSWKFEKNYKETDGSKVTKNYDGLAPFERILINATCNVYYVQGDTTRVKVVATTPEVMAKTSVKSEGGCLKIRTKGWSNWRKNKTVAVYVTSPDLIEVAMHGAGQFRAEGKIDTDTLRLSMEGVGSIKIPSLICDRLQAKVAGAGSIQLSDVTAQETQLSMNGVGSIKVENFQNSGSVHCTMEGVGSIKLGGEVQNFSNYVNGVGSIDAKDLKIKELGEQ